MNYRDHRKITVVDGEVGFLGGINLADEYINRIEKFGHWKDTSVKLEGTAVNTLSILFYNCGSFQQNPTMISINMYQIASWGSWICPGIWGFPFTSFQVTENTYISLLNHAKNYVYITTTYLILDNELLSASPPVRGAE
jgi:cardiolipin synthase